MIRKTKIIATLGPVSSSEEGIRDLILAGVDAMRFNFSHGDHADKKKTFDTLKKVREELGKPITALLDTKGPEIRTGCFEKGKVHLNSGDLFTLTAADLPGDETRVSITYPGLADDVSEGDTILLDDGLIELKVLSTENGEIRTRVQNGGDLSDRKGINVPGVKLSLPYISEADKKDLIFGVETGFDTISASFVRCADDVIALRRYLASIGGEKLKIIAKIESADGVHNIDEILRVCDGVMVARGDMGVEIPLEDVPVMQKVLIKKAYMAGKQVITATQMLESMIKNPRPTRAESTDVANAIYDGTSAIMLSGETAVGKYPIEAVKTMARIALRAESDVDYKKRFMRREERVVDDVTEAISRSTCLMAYDLQASAILAITQMGKTARMVSKYRPGIPIIGCVTDEMVMRQVNLSWGVTPVLLKEQSTTDELFEHAVEMAQRAGLVKHGELVVLTAGVPLGMSGTTNMIKVHIVGNVLVKGQGVNDFVACANLCVAKSEKEALEHFTEGDILCVSTTTNALINLIRKSSGVIAEEEGLESHAAILGRAIDVPVLIGAKGATSILKSGTTVKLDAGRGTVSRADDHPEATGPNA